MEEIKPSESRMPALFALRVAIKDDQFASLQVTAGPLEHRRAYWRTVLEQPEVGVEA